MKVISGVQYNLTNNFSIKFNDQSTPVYTTVPVSQNNVGTNLNYVNTELTAGHLQLTAHVKTNANAKPNTLYTISLHNVANSSAPVGSISFFTPPSINLGETMTFVFDVGAELDTSMAFVLQIV